MSLKSINPTKTKSWTKLIYHFEEIKDTHIDDFFISDKFRSDKFSIDWSNFYFDFSKNKINAKTISLFKELLDEIDFKSSIEKYFMDLIGHMIVLI